MPSFLDLTSLLTTNPSVDNILNHCSMRKKYKTSAVNRAKIAKPKVQPAELTRAAKRLLKYGWMAFRFYYSAAFTSLQQKDTFGFLTRHFVVMVS
jgi:hypothetical protein